ncbi:hypothetical protein CKA38_02490 [Ereboglobus luteus]|uniref:DUF1573 domain-containing protein n=1 Tax=Ereboglobus luteus TaxID=1796921 RepID=A0A2U8E135_9BACT|nr:hypothetical protein CKA38_02490 [Ereboglobus luteus]
MKKVFLSTPGQGGTDIPACAGRGARATARIRMPVSPWQRNIGVRLCVAVFFLLPALRAIDWERTEIEQRAEIGETLPPYEFTFKNSGTAPVSITNARAGCGCLAPVIDRETLAPGETGKVLVKFDRTGLVGEVARTITITTDESRNNTYELTLRANLPEPLTIAPRLVFWKSENSASTKSIDIKINFATPVEITDATCNRDNFDLALVALEPGRHYRLDITPRDIATPRLAVITLKPAAPLPAGTTLTAYAQVR